MPHMKSLMQNLATESGEVELDFDESVAADSSAFLDVLSDDDSTDMGKRIEGADSASDLADKIDEISLSMKTDDMSAEAKKYVYESARRQFRTLALAHGLQGSGISLEASGDHELPNELSRISSSLRRAAEAEKAYSTEGLLSWLRRDAVKLEKAYQVLESAARKIKLRLGKPRPVDDGDHEFRGNTPDRPPLDMMVISSGSLREFLQKGQGQVMDLEKAIKDESSSLHQLHAAADNGLSTLAGFAKQLAENPESATRIYSSKWANEINKGKTNKAALMGNFSIRAKNPEGNPILVDKMRRENDTSGSLLKDVGRSLTTASPEMVGAGLMGALAIGAALSSNTTHNAMAPKLGALAASSAGKAVFNSAVSRAQPTILKRPVAISNESFKKTLDTIIETYARFTSYEHSGEGIVENLNEALKKGKQVKMDPEDYKTLVEVVKALKESLSRIAVITEAICAQATYTVHQMAAVSISVLGKLK